MAKLELQALLSISQIDLVENLNQLLEEILTIVGDQMDAHSGSIMLLNEESGDLEMAATFGLPTDYIDRVYSKGVPITFSPSGVVLKSGRYFTVPNIFEEPRDEPWMDLARELGFSAQLFMPMKRNGEVIGLLNIYMADPHEFTKDEIAFVSIAANQTAAVIENARLYTKLREGEEFNSSLLNNSPNPIVVVNPDTSVRYVNPAFERLTGFSSAELIGTKPPYPWWTKERERQTHTDFETALSNGAYRLEEVFEKKNGERFCVEITSRPVKENGELKYYMANWVDITERKRIDTALQESEEEYRMLVENANEAIVVAQDGVLKFANSQISKITGYSHEELFSKSFLEFIHPDDREMVHENYLRRLKGEESPSVYSLKFIDKEGTTRWMETNGVNFTWEGRPAVLHFLNDITERKKTEDALWESEEKYRTLVDNIQDGIFIIQGNDHPRLVYCNEAFAKMVGYTVEEALKLKFEEYVAPEDLAFVYDRYRRRQAGEDVPQEYEYRALHKDGKTRVFINMNAGLIEHHGHVASIGTAKDVTERKRAEEALREREKWFRSLRQNSSDIIVVLDTEGIVQYVSESVERILGYKPEYLLGKNGFVVFHPDDLEAAKAAFAETVKQPGVNINVVFRALRPDDSLIYLELVGKNLLDDPTVKGVVVNARDITERKRAEETLHESEKWYRTLIQTSSDIIFVLDEVGTIRYMSPTVEGISGYKPEDMVGKNGFSYYHPEDIPALRAAFVGLAQQAGGTVTTVCRAVHKDGSTRYLEIVGNNLLSDPQIRGVVGNCRDITKRKLAEETLRENRELLSNILAASPIGIGLVEVGKGGIDDRKLGWTNESMKKIFGFDPDDDEYVGKSAEAIYATREEYERVGKLFYENLQKGRLAEVEAKLKRKDGSLFDGHIRMSFLDPANPLKGAVAAISDITWRKQAEAELKDSEERLRILFECAPDAYFLTNLEGTLVDANNAAEELSGYQKEELIGKNLLTMNLLPVDQISKETVSLANSARGKPSGPFEIIVIRKGGKKIVAEIRTYPVTIQGETLVLNNARDITRQKRAEEALVTKNKELEREIKRRRRVEIALNLSERKYKEIAEFLPDQIYESILILS